MKAKFCVLAAGILAAGMFQQAGAQSTGAPSPRVSSSATPHSIYIGVKGGISIPNLQSGSNGPEISNGYSSRQGPYFGVFGEFRLSREFSIQAEVNYSSQGGKKEGKQVIPEGTFPGQPAGMALYANFKSVAKLNYIEVPVLARFTFPLGGRFNFMVDAGPYVGFLVRAEDVTSGTSNVYADKEETQPVTPEAVNFDHTTDIKDQLHTANFGLQGGIGFSLNLGEGYLLIHGGGNYGLVDIQKSEKNGKNNTGAATAVIGYALRVR
jgi:hypothetical protein